MSTRHRDESEGENKDADSVLIHEQDVRNEKRGPLVRFVLSLQKLMEMNSFLLQSSASQIEGCLLKLILKGYSEYKGLFLQRLN